MLIGGISKHEMLKTFNCGIGAVLICSEKNKMEILDKLRPENPVVIGSVNMHSSMKSLLSPLNNYITKLIILHNFVIRDIN